MANTPQPGKPQTGGNPDQRTFEELRVHVGELEQHVAVLRHDLNELVIETERLRHRLDDVDHRLADKS